MFKNTGLCAREKVHYSPTELRGSQWNIPQQSFPLDSTIDTFWIREGCPYSGAYKTFIGPRSMAAGVCVCLWDYQFSLRVEKAVKEMECYVIVNWEEGEAAGRTVWMLFKSLHRMKRFGGVLWPLWTTWQMSSNQSKWVQLCSRGTDTQHQCQLQPHSQ